MSCLISCALIPGKILFSNFFFIPGLGRVAELLPLAPKDSVCGVTDSFVANGSSRKNSCGQEASVRTSIKTMHFLCCG